MSYMSQSCNGQTIEQINGEVFINGVNIHTGKLKSYYWSLLAISNGICLSVGFIIGNLP